MILGCEGTLIYTGGILGQRKLGPIANRRGRFRVLILYQTECSAFIVLLSATFALQWAEKSRISAREKGILKPLGSEI